MSVRKTFDVTQFQGDNVTVLRRILDQIGHDSLTFRFTDVIPTVDTVDWHEVVLYDNGTQKRMCVKTGKGNLFCINIYPNLMPGAPVTNVSSGPYNVTANDAVILVDATAAPITVNLPDATTNNGRHLYIKRMNAGSGAAKAVTVDGLGAQTIDGILTQILNVQYVAVEVYSTGANWVII